MKLFAKTNAKLVALYILVFAFFYRAFSIFYFQDDFFFLKVSRATSIKEFLLFFSPIKTFFYRPLSSEVFYFYTHIFHDSLFFAHGLVFILFCVGIYVLYRVLFELTNSRTLSFLTILLYSLHFTHVFQLYFLGTAQEIFAFTFLTISFYGFLKKRYRLSVFFFVCALLSKESAVLFPIFLAVGSIFTLPRWGVHTKKIYIVFALLSLVALIFYKSGSASVVTHEPTYALQFNPKLIVNNTMWYSLWSIGLPNFLPDYFTSILRPPLPAVWAYFESTDAKIYMGSLLLYIATFIGMIIVQYRALVRKMNIRMLLFLLFSFLLFISPTVLIIHKWMVRLTVPLIFISVIQAHVLLKAMQNSRLRIASLFLVLLYITWNFFGVRVHERTSNYMYESSISRNVESYMNTHKINSARHASIYFKDPDRKPDAWGWSKKLETTLHGQDFVDFYFPGKKITVLYGYKDKPSVDSYIIDAQTLMP